MNIENNKCVFPSTISDALIDANNERIKLEEQLNETLDTIKDLTPECDKYDYILAACSGALCGLIDVFLVGKPGESPLGEITDKWFADRTVDFAKYCGFSVMIILYLLLLAILNGNLRYHMTKVSVVECSGN